MVSPNLFKDQFNYLTKKFLHWTLYALLSIASIHLYLYPTSLFFSSTTPPQFLISNHTILNSSSFPPPPQEKKITKNVEISCDYSDGKWVYDKKGPLYNGTTCNTIKDNQNCMSHGRPDQDYLYWRWTPRNCKISRFDPKIFLQLLRNKHLAFVGDSMARNQLESLMCMLSTASKPNLVYKHGSDNKFRRWNFPEYNANVSIYWSPFLVNGVEKNDKDVNYNKLQLKSVNEKWAADIEKMDMIVLSVGHWFLHPAVYYYGDKVLGCHYCQPQNFTEIEFYGVFGKALNTTLKAIIDRKGGNKKDPFDVFVTTFSPHHFEGEWDRFGACPKTKPYKESEKKLEGMDFDMRKAEIEEVNAAKEIVKGFDNLRIESLDVTKLSLLRPDGHPGPYLYPFPFANGIGERVQNDCVHWCLPGPVDTWNEIFLDVLRRWHVQRDISTVL